MKKRYLPFGYQITDGKTTIVQEEAEAVQHIFEEYIAGKSLRKIAESMTTRKTPYHEDTQKWNQNMVSRVLANEIYCGNEKYPPIITEVQYRLADKFRRRKRKHTLRFYSRFAKIYNADVAENAYTGGIKPNNGFAANVECGQSPSKKKNCLMLLQ